jgi:hypothetical protein
MKGNEFICLVSWEGHISVEKWKLAAKLPTETPILEINKRIGELVKDERYFRICQECDETIPLGMMHDEITCQGCAQGIHEIIY